MPFWRQIYRLNQSNYHRNIIDPFQNAILFYAVIRARAAQDVPAADDGLHLPLRLREDEDREFGEILRVEGNSYGAGIPAGASLHVRLVFLA